MIRICACFIFCLFHSDLATEIAKMNNLTLIDVCSMSNIREAGCDCQSEDGIYDECSFLICSVVAIIVMVVNGFMINKASKLYDLIILRYGLQFVLIANFISGTFGKV